MNEIEHTFDVLEHFIVPEPHDPESLRFEEDSSNRIFCLLFRMLSAIELDYQPCFEAHEIDDIGADDLLPSEFKADELAAAQMLPEQSLSIGLLDTQRAR